MDTEVLASQLPTPIPRGSSLWSQGGTCNRLHGCVASLTFTIPAPVPLQNLKCVLWRPSLPTSAWQVELARVIGDKDMEAYALRVVAEDGLDSPGVSLKAAQDEF